MKANLKGSGGLKGLLLAHGEKLGIFVFGLCAAMFVYASMGREGLSDRFQAANLEKEITQTRSDVENFTWEKAKEISPEEVLEAEPFTAGGDISVPPQAYSTWRYGWSRPVVPPTQLRTDPTLLAALELEVHGGSGLLAFVDENIRRQRELERKREQDRKAKEREMQRDRQANNPPERNPRNRRNERRDGALGKDGNRRPAAGGRASQSVGISTRGDERIEKAYWAVVVAKVPIAEQLKLYQESLEHSRVYSPQADFPKYMGYFVERAEVRADGKLTWSRASVYDGKGKRIGSAVMGKSLDQAISEWAGSPSEVADSRFLDRESILAFPLPPLVGRSWGSEATHSEIPLASLGLGMEDEEEVDTDEEEELEAGEDDDLDFSASADFQRSSGRSGKKGPRVTRGKQRGGGGGYGSGMMGMEMGGLGGGYGGGMGMGMEGEGYGGMGGMSGMGGRGRRGQAGQLPRSVQHWLLRFFDFAVQPGKKYKYRIQLVMEDVNRGASGPQFKKSLDSTVLKRLREADVSARKRGKKKASPIRLTEWSKPSATVSIPQAGSVRVAEAKAPAEKLFNSKPSTKLLVESFDVDEDGKAIQAALEEEFRRGSVLNMQKDAEILVEQGRYIEKIEDFKFRTGITVLDIRGGQRLAKDIQQPANVLLMDSAGQIFVRNELDDFLDVDHHRTVFKESDKKRGQRGGRPDDAGGYGESGLGDGMMFEGF